MGHEDKAWGMEYDAKKGMGLSTKNPKKI